MSSSLSIGMSGMQAAQRRLDVSAHNIANVATDGFQRQRVLAQTQPTGGVGVQVEPDGSPAAPAFGQDLIADVVAQRQAQHLFTANLRTVQTADRMLGSLLDAFA
jgi:flagellar hook-associated protein FlgK